MQIANSGTLYFCGQPVLEAVNDFLKPREAKVYQLTKTVKPAPVVVVRDEKEIRLRRLQRIMERTRKQRIRRKLENRIYKLERCS